MPAHERNKLCMVWAAAGQDHVTSECGAREMSHIVNVPFNKSREIWEM